MVDCDGSVLVARALVRARAPGIGFTSKDCAELVIVVSELTSNIVKYGVRGTIEVTEVMDEVRGPGICIIATDETGVFDLTGATRDGHDATGKLDPFRLYGRRGIGAGLGAVSRFSDAMEMTPTDSGKRLAVTRYVRKLKRPFP